MPKLLPAILAGACALLQGAQAPVLYTDQNMPPAVLEELTRGQDLAMGLRYDEAEAVIRKAMAKAPEHPLGHVFLLATLLGRVQEDFRRGHREIRPGLFEEVDQTLKLANAEAAAFPDSAYPRLYLGAAYGVRGLARLYNASYFSSYRDGKRGVALLREAVAIEPQLYDAYMGLGQFEYYCGTLGGVLQFLLALPGDPDKGLQMLKTCEEKATYAAWPCKAYRVKLIIQDRKDYAAVEPELAGLVARYPGNFDFANAVFKSLDNGINTAALRRAAEDILRRLDQGWTLPNYAVFDRDAQRMVLAQAYLQAGDAPAAQEHLRRLGADAAKPALRKQALSLLAKP